jgi:uncharacterized protein
MNPSICYETDLLELSPEDVEKCYGPFEDIDKVDSYGDTLLLAACKNKQIENVKHYLKLGANPDFVNGCGDSPLHVVIDTATHNEPTALEIIKILIDAGADLEVRGYMDKTPFLRACCRESLAVLRILVEAGCDTKATITDFDETCDGEYFADVFHLKQELKDYIRNVKNS